MKITFRRVLPVLMLLSSHTVAHAQQQALMPDAVRPAWRSEIPVAVYPDTALVHLYETAWDIAAGRVRRGPAGLPASPYLDENCYDDQIWIWDTCFMTLYTKYCPSVFPGKETLMDLYAPLHDRVYTPLKIHLRDNPPIFAWTENAYYHFTGDRRQAEMVVKYKRYLQRHFDFFNSIPKGDVDTLASVYYNPIHRGVVRDDAGYIIGYTWHGGASGMDNTPRGREAGGADSILWVDAISQQALSALCISQMAAELGDKAEARLWKNRYDSIRTTVNRLYWDEQDGFYYDISVKDHRPCRIKTVASFWPMLAGIPSKKQAERMLKYLESDKYMGGKYPWNSLSRDDRDYDGKTGEYWRGGVWLPTAYMGTKALEKYGFYELADSLARRVVMQQLRTYQHYAPHTIWETYSPVADLPSTEYGNRVRPDFCGWSALGPISMFIENLMGFRSIDALTQTVHWDIKPENGRHGLKHLRFGGIVCSMVYDPSTHSVEAATNEPFTLVANGQKIRVKRGEGVYKVKK